MLAGLWFGRQKPNFDSFFGEFVSQALELGGQGLRWILNGQEITSRIFFPIFAADSVARCQVQGINQFNGEYSCPRCLIKGKNYKSSERAHKWIFAPTEVAQPRSHEQFIKSLLDLKQKLLEGKSVPSYVGIKSASRLLTLPKFDVVHGFVFDYMHTALLGIARSMFFAWTESKNHNHIILEIEPRK